MRKPTEQEVKKALKSKCASTQTVALACATMLEHCADPNDDILSLKPLFGAAPDLLAVLKEFAAWNKKYPSSNIYSEGEIRRIARELDDIYDRAKVAIAAAEGKEVGNG